MAYDEKLPAAAHEADGLVNFVDSRQVRAGGTHAADDATMRAGRERASAWPAPGVQWHGKGEWSGSGERRWAGATGWRLRDCKETLA